MPLLDFVFEPDVGLTLQRLYAEITMAVNGQTHVVDARPSDALALAVRAGVPIYAARAVLEQASGPDDDTFWMAMAERVRQFHAQAGQPEPAPSPALPAAD